jgi:hypothetical protein
MTEKKKCQYSTCKIWFILNARPILANTVPFLYFFNDIKGVSGFLVDEVCEYFVCRVGCRRTIEFCVVVADLVLGSLFRIFYGQHGNLG